MANMGMYGVFDPAIMVQKHNAFTTCAGHSSSPQYRAAKEDILFSIYEKDGSYYPVNLVINAEDGDLESTRMNEKTLHSLRGARKYMGVPLKTLNELWDNKWDHEALSHKGEMKSKIEKVVKDLTTMPVDEAIKMGVTVYSVNGTPLTPRPEAKQKPEYV